MFVNPLKPMRSRNYLYSQLSNEKIGVQGPTASKGPSQDGCPDRLARECTQVAPFIFRLLLRRKTLRQEEGRLDKGGGHPRPTGDERGEASFAPGLLPGRAGDSWAGSDQTGSLLAVRGGA